MVSKFKVNDRVKRIEDRENVSSTVLEVIQTLDGDSIYLISYDEGGFGYWFESDLELIDV
jgi:hypothetical protein